MAIDKIMRSLSTGRRILTFENSGRMPEFSDELTVSSSDSVFGFLEGSIESTGSGGDDLFDVVENEEDCEGYFEENKMFWENQHNSVQATLCRTTSIETGIRNVTRKAIKELKTDMNYCKCSKMVNDDDDNSCRNCLMNEVSTRLRDAGYNTAICRSKWRNSPDIPSGEHSFLDVIDNSNPIKGEIRVIIELNFRAEFEMARANEEYNQLVTRLPEIFVAKIERLAVLIKILCTAAKKCMKDKKMHMGPWRKQKYMQAKWFSSNCERIMVKVNTQSNWVDSKQASKPRRASMLTMALLNVPCKAVAAA